MDAPSSVSVLILLWPLGVAALRGADVACPCARLQRAHDNNGVLRLLRDTIWRYEPGGGIDGLIITLNINVREHPAPPPEHSRVPSATLIHGHRSEAV
jgi:hypothetical protein